MGLNNERGRRLLGSSRNSIFFFGLGSYADPRLMLGGSDCVCWVIRCRVPHSQGSSCRRSMSARGDQFQFSHSHSCHDVCRWPAQKFYPSSIANCKVYLPESFRDSLKSFLLCSCKTSPSMPWTSCLSGTRSSVLILLSSLYATS